MSHLMAPRSCSPALWCNSRTARLRLKQNSNVTMCSLIDVSGIYVSRTMEDVCSPRRVSIMTQKTGLIKTTRKIPLNNHIRKHGDSAKFWWYIWKVIRGKTKRTGNFLSGNFFLKRVTERKIERRRRWRRRRNQLLNGFKETRKNPNFKEGTVRLTLCRARFGRVYGPVVSYSHARSSEQNNINNYDDNNYKNKILWVILNCK